MKLRLITKADLKRHLPRELPFRDRTLRLKTIQGGRGRQGAYFVIYRDEELYGMLGIGRLPRRLLPKLLREELRAMYWNLVRRTPATITDYYTRLLSGSGTGSRTRRR